jgi:uncharacterized protein (TIGR02145 family)
MKKLNSFFKIKLKGLFRFIFFILILLMFASCKKHLADFKPILVREPTPPDKAVIDHSVDLSWKCEGYPLKYDIYLGTTENPSLIQSDFSENIYYPGKLEMGIQYFWKIVAKDINNNRVESDLWSFYIVLKDYDRNIYKTIKIGGQWWMSENLKTTKYRNGDAIIFVPDSLNWNLLLNGGYCYYDNIVSNSVVYGNLYNWYAVTDNRSICPEGWHVPNESDWKTLIEFLGGENVAGGKLKESGTLHWLSPNLGATNESGFTALAGGNRDSKSGNGDSFKNLGLDAYFWNSPYSGNNINLSKESAQVLYVSKDSNMGLSVRCVKD